MYENVIDIIDVTGKKRNIVDETKLRKINDIVTHEFQKDYCFINYYHYRVLLITISTKPCTSNSETIKELIISLKRLFRIQRIDGLEISFVRSSRQ